MVWGLDFGSASLPAYSEFSEDPMCARRGENGFGEDAGNSSMETEIMQSRGPK